jgi:catechol-2,3-dioxygenase
VPGGQAGLQHFALLVDDLDAWVEYLRAREVPLRGQPFAFEMTQEKCRGLFIADPEGNPVELFERTPK